MHVLHFVHMIALNSKTVAGVELSIDVTKQGNSCGGKGVDAAVFPRLYCPGILDCPVCAKYRIKI